MDAQINHGRQETEGAKQTSFEGVSVPSMSEEEIVDVVKEITLATQLHGNQDKPIRVIIGSNAQCEPVDKKEPFTVLVNDEYRSVDRKELERLGIEPFAVHTLSASGGVATAVKQITSYPKCLVAPDAAPKDSSLDKHCSREELESLKKAFPALFDKTDLTLYPISDWDRKEHYGAVSNGHYWPAFHKLLANLPDNYPTRSAYETYHQVNRRMADYLIKEAISEKAQEFDNIIWVHDYQLCEVPMMVREALPDAKVGFFLHIPFCEPHDFIESMTEGHARDVVRGLLGSDLVAFHVPEYANNFLGCCKELGYQIETTDSGKYVVVPELDKDGNPTVRMARVISAPISIDSENIRRVIQYDPATDKREQEIEDAIQAAVKWKRDNPGMKLLLGAERLDYSKGIPERILAVKYILEHEDEFPGAARNFVFRQEAVPSRAGVLQYDLLGQSVKFLVKETNDYARAKYRDHKYARLADAVENITNEVNYPQVDNLEKGNQKIRVVHYEHLVEAIEALHKLVAGYEGDRADKNFQFFADFDLMVRRDVNEIGGYDKFTEESVEKLKDDVNERARTEYPSKAWNPISFGGGIKQKSLYAHAAVADAIVVNPEYDGMNLVIKETILAKYFAQHAKEVEKTFEPEVREFLDIASTTGSSFILGAGTGAAMELVHADLGDKLRIVDGRDRKSKEDKEEYIHELALAIYGALGLDVTDPREQKTQYELQVENVEMLADHFRRFDLKGWVEKNIKEIRRSALTRQTSAKRLSAGTVETCTEYGRTKAQGLRSARFSRVVNDSVVMRQDLETDRILRALKDSKGNTTWVATLDEQQAATSPLFREQLGGLLKSVPGDKLHLILRGDVDADEVARTIPGAIIHSENEIQQNRWVERKLDQLMDAVADSSLLREYSPVDWSIEGGELIASFDEYKPTLRKYARDLEIDKAAEIVMKIAKEESDFREGELKVTRKGDRVFFTTRIFSPEHIVREIKKEDKDSTVVLVSEKADDVSAFEKADYGIFIGHTDGSPRKAYGLENVFNILSFGDMGPLLRRYARN